MGTTISKKADQQVINDVPRKTVEVSFKRVTKKEHELYRVPVYTYLVP